MSIPKNGQVCLRTGGCAPDGSAAGPIVTTPTAGNKPLGPPRCPGQQADLAIVFPQMQHTDQTPAGRMLTFGGYLLQARPARARHGDRHRHATLAVTRRSCIVTGIDDAPALPREAPPRAGAENLQAEFKEADAGELPCADASFDYLSSAIEVMLTAHYQRATEELLRAGLPGHGHDESMTSAPEPPWSSIPPPVLNIHGEWTSSICPPERGEPDAGASEVPKPRHRRDMRRTARISGRSGRLTTVDQPSWPPAPSQRSARPVVGRAGRPLLV